jgi:glycerol dehydrogenase
VHNGLTTNSHTHEYLHGEKVAFGLLVQLVAEGKSKSLIDEIMTFCQSVGLPLTLAQVGIKKLSKEELMQIATRSCAPGETAHNEPFEVTPALVADAIIAADKLGQNHLDQTRSKAY